jgi:hypothetical protein
LIVIIWPMLSTAFIDDDGFNSLLPVRAHFGGFDYWGAMRSDISGEAAEGRFFPAMIGLLYATYAAFPTLTVYKAWIFTLIIVDAIALAFLIRRLTNSAPLAWIGILVFAAGIQFRNFHDPVIAFHGAMQVLFLLIVLSLLAFLYALRSDRLWPLALAAISYGAALLMYESVYGLCILYPFVAWRSGRTRRNAAVVSSPMVIIAGVVLIITLILRANAPSQSLGSSVTIGYDFRAVAKAFSEQVIAAIPGTYTLFDPAGFLKLLPHYPARGFVVACAVFGVSALALLSLLRRRACAVDLTLITGLGVGLWTLPAVPVALALKYQGQLTWGLGHLNVYLQIIGVSLLAVAFAAWLASSSVPVKSLVAVSFSLLLACGSCATAETNASIGWLFSSVRDDRSVIAEALKAGALRGVPDGAYILWPSVHAGMCFDGQACAQGTNFGYFLYEYSGFRGHVIAADATALNRLGCPVTSGVCDVGNQPVFIVRESLLDMNGNAYFLRGRADKIRLGPGGVIDADISKPSLYVRIKLAVPGAVRISGAGTVSLIPVSNSSFFAPVPALRAPQWLSNISIILE